MYRYAGLLCLQRYALADRRVLVQALIQNVGGQSLSLEFCPFHQRNQVFHQKSAYIPTVFTLLTLQVLHLSFIFEVFFQRSSVAFCLSWTLLIFLRLPFILKCVAIIFILRMQILSTLMPSGQDGLNKEAPRLLFPEYLMVPHCLQRFEFPVCSECPMNPQDYHYQTVCTLCRSNMQLVV